MALTIDLRRFFDIRPGELRRIALMASVLCLLVAANNVIKIVRDSLFLSRFPIGQLPYVILLAALVASVVIVSYSRYTAKVELSRVIRSSMAFTIANVVVFWLLIVFYNAAWVLYAYYIWSAIAGLLLVSQFWILANGMFNPRDGKRLFGIITAGGTLGVMIGGLAAKWAVSVFSGSEHLLWLVVVLIAAAFFVIVVVLKERDGMAGAELASPSAPAQDARGAIETVLGSPYLKTISALIFVSVIVSTLVDFQFKAAAKAAYSTADELAGFFGSYYAWLGAVTMLAQLWLTRKVLTGLGLTPSLLVLPATLFAGSLALLIWPGLLPATANRMAEATLRTSVNQSGVQILYLPIADAIRRKVKVLLDVAVERLGDGAAAVIILSSSLVLGASAPTHLSYVVIALLILWIGLILSAHKGYVDGLRRGLVFRDVPLEAVRLDFTDKAAIEAVFNSLDEKDEASVLFALELAERMGADSAIVHLRPLPFLLRHESPEVRRRSLTLVASSLDPHALAMVLGLLISDDNQVRSEAAQILEAILEKSAVPSVWPWLQNSDLRNQTWALGAKLLSSDGQIRRKALQTLRELVEDPSAESAKQRVEAARLMASLIEPEFGAHLIRLVRDDPSSIVVREAMVAAAQGKYSAVIPEVIARLGINSSKAAAREALVEYGEIALKSLRTSLSDTRVSRSIRLNIPGVLSKIHSQAAMNALMGGLLEEDRSIRFKVILAIEEMSRLFADLKGDREIVEGAIMSDTHLYCRRLAIFSALFDQGKNSVAYEDSLLYHALKESMDRVLERVMWLLALIYPAKDIRRVWSGLQSADAHQRANATEFIDNLLTGNIKKYMLPLYSDDQPDQRLRAALAALGIDSMDAASALKALLMQEDRWLVTATIWEIGIRKLLGFRDGIAKLERSDDAVIRETANLVIQDL